MSNLPRLIFIIVPSRGRDLFLNLYLTFINNCIGTLLNRPKKKENQDIFSSILFKRLTFIFKQSPVIEVY